MCKVSDEIDNLHYNVVRLILVFCKINNLNMQDYKASIEMQVRKFDKENFVVASFKGELDKAGLDVVKEELNTLAEEFQSKYLVFDFTELNFINSEGIGFLMTIHYRLSKREKELVVVGAADHVHDVLSVIGLLTVIKHFKTLEEFKTSLS